MAYGWPLGARTWRTDRARPDRDPDADSKSSSRTMSRVPPCTSWMLPILDRMMLLVIMSSITEYIADSPTDVEGGGARHTGQVGCRFALEHCLVHELVHVLHSTWWQAYLDTARVTSWLLMHTGHSYTSFMYATFFHHR